MTYRLSREAERDLEDIEAYTSLKWGDDRAETYIHALYDAFQRLGAAPGLGRKRQDIPQPYLVYGVGSHLIIYRHNQAKGRVEILNILHPMMNIDKRLVEALKRKKDTL